MKLLINLSDRKEYLHSSKLDFNKHDGLILFSKLKNNEIVESSTGQKFLVIEPNSYDLFKKGFKRGPQIIDIKDSSYILLRSGIDSKSNVFETGTGSGALTIQLSKIVKKVTSLEIRKEHFKLAEKNLKIMNCDNVEIINEDAELYDFKNEKFSHYFLDMKKPWEVKVNNLKIGGILTIYVPTINQVQESVNFYEENFKIQEISEIIKRKWKTKNITRPENIGLTHTGFLMFLRKIK